LIFYQFIFSIGTYESITPAYSLAADFTIIVFHLPFIPRRTNSKAALLPNSLNQPNHHRQYRSVGNVVELKSNSHLQSPKNDASDQSRVLPINASQDLSLTMKNNISSNKLLLEAKTELKKRLQEGIASKRPSRVEEPG
jgi:hypothetical protein